MTQFNWEKFIDPNMNTVLNNFQQEMSQLYERFFSGSGSETKNTHFPFMNLYEDKENLYVTAEIPGLGVDDVNIEIENDMLHLSGDRKSELDDQTCYFHCQERGAGAFNKKINIPCRIEIDKVTAEMNHGVLKITMPKASDLKAKKIVIKSS